MKNLWSIGLEKRPVVVGSVVALLVSVGVTLTFASTARAEAAGASEEPKPIPLGEK